MTDYNTTFEINGTTDAVFNVTVINANNTNENATITGFTFDGTPPAVTIDTPTESSPVYKNGGALFFVNFTYSELNPKNYTVAIRNSTSVINSTTNSSVVGGTGLFANESFNLNSTAADGNYNVTVMMYNNVSLSYTAYQNYSVVNDNLAPQITSSSLQPSDGSTTTDTTPTISASYSDSGSGMSISSVIVTLDGTDVTASATVIASGVTYTPSTALSYATHTVSLSVADKATNTASKTWSFTVSSGRRGGRGVPRDSDGDGYSDVDEMLAGTNPNAPDDFPNKPETTPEPTPEPIAKPSPTVQPTAPLPAPTPTSEPTAATPTPEEPGFESVFAIAGLLAVAYLVRKLKK